ncbi:hypothetical protein HKD37_07G019542 [Glycine soja]
MSQRSNASSSRTRVSSQVVLLCGCGRRAVRRVAGTNINRGRTFFTCSINKHLELMIHLGHFPWNKEDNLEERKIRQCGKAQVNSKLDCMGIEMKMFRTIVYGMFLIQLLSMVVFVCIHKY